MRDLIGRTLGHYRIVEKIGEGGMGEVYRAHDERLDRDVAIKVLPESVAVDPERLRRFEREAKAVAALSHPNILEIFDFDTDGDVTFSATELLEGETLREHIHKEPGPLPWRRVQEIGAAVASGLGAAHGKAVVHRDIKPSNIFLCLDGRVKILDFGLAATHEAVDGEAETASIEAPLTREGSVMGTVGYMAPEQLRGETADARSDIFALGCVLYEMLEGRAAFLRTGAAETSAAILREEPSPLANAGLELPAEFERIVRRCLEKSPETRFQSSSDLAYNLRSVTTDHSVPVVTSPAVTPMRRGRRTMWISAGAIVLVAAGLFAWMTFSSSTRDLPPMNTVPLTSLPGDEYEPALSPDGSMVAFVRTTGLGTAGVYVKLIGEGDPLLVSNSESNAWSPAWSPDGRKVAYYSATVTEEGPFSATIDSAAALGGATRTLATSIDVDSWGLSWSPDGSTIAMVTRESSDDPSAVFLLSLSTGEMRRLTEPSADHLGDLYPKFSPDGRTIGFVRQRTLQSGIYLVQAAGGDPQPLVTGNVFTSGFDWTPDGREIVFSAVRPGASHTEALLWRVSLAGGEPTVLPVGEEGYHPTVSRQGELMGYLKISGKVDLWRVGGPLADGSERSSERFIYSSGYGSANTNPRYSPDGEMIAFGSRRSGFNEVWVCDRNGENQTQLTYLEGWSGYPSWSPDGLRIAFASISEGDWGVYVTGVTGGIPRRLTGSDSYDDNPTWSRDGRWIYFRSNRNGHSFELFKMPAEGGEAVQLTSGGGFFGVESPDGGSLLFTKREPWGGPYGIWQMPSEGGEEVKIHDHGEGFSWEVLVDGICYLNLESSPSAIEFLEFSSGGLKRGAKVEDDATYWGFTVSPDGRWVVYQRQELENDTMLVENFR